jgi:hypothetical protein
VPKLIRGVIAFAGALAVLNGADYKDLSRKLALNPDGAVHLETFSGSVQVSTWDRAEVEVKARIEAAGSSAADRLGDSEAATQRGDVHLLLPRDSRFNLQAAPPRRGLIQSDFQILAHMAAGRLGFNIDGAVNGGGPALRLLTARGTVQLQAK